MVSDGEDVPEEQKVTDAPSRGEVSPNEGKAGNSGRTDKTSVKRCAQGEKSSTSESSLEINFPYSEYSCQS